jgi:predicted transposase YbfD/YdcC
MGDWLNSYKLALMALFEVPRIPSYSALRRVMLTINYEEYSARLARFFEISPEEGETLAVDGKMLRGSFLLEQGNPHDVPHKAITLVSAFLVERGLILKPQQVEDKSNEIKALPALIEGLALKGVVFAFDSMNTQKKTIKTIVDSNNHYLAAVKGNQPKLYQGIQQEFMEKDSFKQVNKGHGRWEKRKVSISDVSPQSFPNWPALKTIIKVEKESKTRRGVEKSIRYYISDLQETAQQFAARIRGYWGVENKVHYVRDVTQGEDQSRIRTSPLPQIWAIARNLAINLYRDAGFTNMAQAQRKCQHGLEQILALFKMK